MTDGGTARATPPAKRAPQREPHPGYIAVGRVARPWGLHGDIKVESLTDFPERFQPGERLWLAGAPCVVERARWQKGALYLKLAGIDDTAAAEAERGRLLEIPEGELHPLDEDEYYHHQLIGLVVQTEGGDDLGRVAEVLPTGGNAVLIVRGPRGELLIPFIEDVLKRVDLAGGVLTVELIDGLIQETRAPARAGRPRRKGRRPPPRD